MTSTPNTVAHKSTTTITPTAAVADRIDLTPWDLSMLTLHYLQKGLVFFTPNSSTAERRIIVDRLKSSLSTALLHFYQLAGRLATEKGPNDCGFAFYIDYHGQGVEFVHAVDEQVRVEDVVGTFDGPPPFHKYIPLNGAVNHDGLTLPLLAIQVTELLDGLFVGCSCNHMVVDGTSFWHFLNSWAEISRSEDDHMISRPPIIRRWHAEDTPPPYFVRHSHQSEIIERFMPSEAISERRFLFLMGSLKRLKEKANSEANLATYGTSMAISTFQSLAALVWRAIARAYNLPSDALTTCAVVANERRRLNPPLSSNCVGCYIHVVSIAVPAGELLENNLGWSSTKLHDAIVAHDHNTVVGEYKSLAEMPEVVSLSDFERGTILMASSPRFDMYDGVDFGWGKPVAVRGGAGNRLDGRVSFNRGRDGERSIEVEVFLPPAAMAVLEVDPELIAAME